MRADQTVGVAAPATSANLGPGFDAFAVALDLQLQVRTSRRGERRVQTSGEGAGELPADEGNLLWRALVAFCDWAGAPVPDVSLRVDNPIPLERGLGSSAAAVVAGLAVGRAFCGTGTDEQLIELATGFEGHADNAAAAVLGGLVVAVDGHVQRLEPASALRPLVAIPAARQSTSAARRALPTHLELDVAAANTARGALTLAGLAGTVALHPPMMRDALHEPTRLAMMPDSGRLVQRLRGSGLAACLSGAGPSVLAVVPSGDQTAVDRVAPLLPAGWRLHAGTWQRTGVTTCPADRRWQGESMERGTWRTASGGLH